MSIARVDMSLNLVACCPPPRWPSLPWAELIRRAVKTCCCQIGGRIVGAWRERAPSDPAPLVGRYVARRAPRSGGRSAGVPACGSRAGTAAPPSRPVVLEAACQGPSVGRSADGARASVRTCARARARPARRVVPAVRRDHLVPPSRSHFPLLLMSHTEERAPVRWSRATCRARPARMPPQPECSFGTCLTEKVAGGNLIAERSAGKH